VWVLRAVTSQPAQAWCGWFSEPAHSWLDRHSTTIGRLLHELGYSLQSVRKSREGASHPDRNAQFEYINAMAERFLRRKQPVISVDTKKKELVGEFKNGGRE